MSWAKLDDHFPTHPKVIEVGGDAGWLYVCALCYSAEHLTDGKVLKRLVSRLSDRKKPLALAARLVAAALWRDHGDHYEINDYLRYNPSRAQVEAEREAARERKANLGRKGGQSSREPTVEVRLEEQSPVPVPEVLSEPKKARQRTNVAPTKDFEPTDVHREYAEVHGLTLVAERDHWLDHCEAKGTTYKVVNAGFSTWLRQAVSFGRGRTPASNGRPEPVRPLLGKWKCRRGNPLCVNGNIEREDGLVVQCGCQAIRAVS